MKFETIERETVILNPRKNMKRKTIPSEIRKDPLTGRTSRISHFMSLKWEKPDFDQLVAGTEKTCPFCPDKILSAVATLGDRHYIPMTDFETERLADGFRLAFKFFQQVSKINHPESVYHLVSQNYMPASGSTLVHPHYQVFATSYAPNQLREELQAAESYVFGKNRTVELVDGVCPFGCCRRCRRCCR
jgi:galactose-1-phosphate uridylyltransferase